MFWGTIHYHLGTERGKPSIIISVNALHFRSALCHVNLISIDGTLFQTGIPLWFYISMFLFKALSVTSLLPYPWRCCLSQIWDECCCSLVLTSGNFLFSLFFLFIYWNVWSFACSAYLYTQLYFSHLNCHLPSCGKGLYTRSMRKIHTFCILPNSNNHVKGQKTKQLLENILNLFNN